MNTNYNKFIYVGFLAIGIYHAGIEKDYMEAASSFGIWLAFDPFDPTKKWQERALWQKAILLLHLGITAALFGYGIGINE